MAFSENLKLSVKRQAHFRCCLCHNIGVEIHHIVPQSEDGSDEVENAAPLCPSCHETYGANLQKRKFIRESRDFWYEICAKRYASDPSQLEEISEKLDVAASKSDVENVVQRVTDLISNALLKDAPENDTDSEGEQLIPIKLPERHWVVLLGVLDPVIRQNSDYIKKMSGGKKVSAKTADELVGKLPLELRTVLAGPIIISSIIVDRLIETGVLQPAKPKEMGASPLLEMIKGYNEQIRKETELEERSKQDVKISRNSPCSCGSGKKHKYCCGQRKQH